MPTHDTTHIPEGWRETTLGELLQPKGYIRGPFGSALLRSELLESGIPVYEQQNAIYNHRNFRFYINEEKYESMKRFTVAENDLIISCSGTLGKVSLIKKKDAKGIISQALLLLRPNPDKINPMYLYNFFNSKEGFNALVSRSTGSVQVNLAKREIIESVPFLLPPLPEQGAIADMLSSLDAKIELLREQNKTLEKTAQTIFHEWFGKYSVESPEELPEGWRVGKLGEEFDIVMGQSPDGESYNETGDGTVFFQGRAEFTDRFPTIRLYTTEPKRIAEKFDVLVSVRAPVGDINVASEKCCIGRGLAAVKSKHQSYCLYKIKSLKESFDKFESEGTVFGSINKDSFNNIEVVLPTNNVILQFEELVKPIDEKIFNNYQEIQSLSKTRDTLLPKLMSGEVRVV